MIPGWFKDLITLKDPIDPSFRHRYDRTLDVTTHSDSLPQFVAEYPGERTREENDELERRQQAVINLELANAHQRERQANITMEAIQECTIAMREILSTPGSTPKHVVLVKCDVLDEKLRIAIDRAEDPKTQRQLLDWLLQLREVSRRIS